MRGKMSARTVRFRVGSRRQRRRVWTRRRMRTLPDVSDARWTGTLTLVCILLESARGVHNDLTSYKLNKSGRIHLATVVTLTKDEDPQKCRA